MRPMFAAGLLFLSAADGAAQETWRIHRTPVIDISGWRYGNRSAFDDLAGATRLSDGTVLVADRVNTIGVIDALGNVVKTVDHPIHAIWWAGRCGPDSFLVSDYVDRRASIIDGRGEIVRQFTVPVLGDTVDRPFRFSCSRDGSIVYRGPPRPVWVKSPNVKQGITYLEQSVYRAAGDGSILQRLGDFPAGEVFAIANPNIPLGNYSFGGNRHGVPRMLAPHASVGSLDDAVVISSADSAFVTIVRADGVTTRHTLPISLRATAKAEFDAAVVSAAAVVPRDMRLEAIDQMSRAPIPPRLPPISALIPDTEGLMWVQTTPPGSNAVDFLVMNSAGNVVARTHLPMNLAVLEIGKDYVLGTYVDTSGVTHVAVLPLQR